jgi:hypothetical protein
MHAHYWAQNIIPAMAGFAYPDRCKKEERRMVRHFDNAPGHCTVSVAGAIADHELLRTKHPAYNPDFSPCSVLSFG